MKPLLLFCASLFTILTHAQISITSSGTPYTENFNSLAISGTSSILPAGWLFTEVGTNANTTYSADNGASNSGNTFSYGSTSTTERALGSLQSGSLISTLGVAYTNNTGGVITSLVISYTGEMWRAGVTNRNLADRLDFQYSTDATSLATGVWTDANSLDFSSPNISVTAGALDGNSITNQVALSFTITGLNIANGATFYLRWTDFNIASSDDGLAIDDFSLTANGTSLPVCTTPSAQASAFVSSSITQTSFTVSWTHANPLPDKYVVTMGPTANVPAGPADGVTYVVGDAVANGNVVYKGSNNTFSLSNLSPGNTYWFYIWPVNDQCTGGPLYNRVTPLRASVVTLITPACAAPTQAATSLTLTPASTSVSGSFTAAGDADSYLVVYSTNSSHGFSPVNTTAYTAGQTVGNVIVAKSGAGTTFSANGLTASTQYYFFVYSMNSIGCTGGPLYFATALSGTSTTLAPNNNIPVGYYDTTIAKSCADLKSALKWRTGFDVNKNPVVPKTYGDLWIQYLVSDLKPREVGSGSTNVIWDIYSDNPNGTDPYNFIPGPVASGGQQDNGTNVSGESFLYNREHTVPLDWFDGNTSNNGAATDYFHILPTDKWVNALRSSFIYGEVTNPTTTSLNGSKLGPNAFAGLTGTAFEPINEYKGDVARAFLYFVTRYEANMSSYTGGNEGTKAFEPNTFPSVDVPYLQLMLKWHSQDPVSQKELDRNDAGFTYQSNRNPFVDHPEYVGIIWNATCPGLGALPVSISWFKGTLKGTNVELNWAAQNEINFNRYEVQRSVNGTSFETIGTVKARNAGKYGYTDNVASLGDRRLYYRLKLIDNDGSSKYSAVYSVHVKANTPFQVYPNPASSSLTIELGSTPFTGSISISDMTGRILISKQVQKVSGAFLLPVQQLSTGRYQLKLMSSNASGINSSVPVNIVR